MTNYSSAHLGTRLADFPVELRVFFDDQDVPFASLALQHSIE